MYFNISESSINDLIIKDSLFKYLQIYGKVYVTLNENTKFSHSIKIKF